MLCGSNWKDTARCVLTINRTDIWEAYAGMLRRRYRDVFISLNFVKFYNRVAFLFGMTTRILSITSLLQAESLLTKGA
jgi:hypothetical protein